MENTSLIQKQERLFEEKLCDTLDSRNKLYKLRDLIGINIGLGENSTLRMEDRADRPNLPW